MMKILQTAERVSPTDLSDNYVFQRSILAYYEAAKLVHGNVLELGSGEGYGIELLAPQATSYVCLDKHAPGIDFSAYPNVEFKQSTFPPLTNFADHTFDFVVTFQVIEHIPNDQLFVKEIARVLKPGGKMIVTTPNKKMSITRNPWHVREYTLSELETLLLKSFVSVEKKGVSGNAKIMAYYDKNKASVRRITRFDVLNLQYLLPRQLLQIPYDILNRMNRKKLLENNTGLVSDITKEDYAIQTADEQCFDWFYIAEKK
jgi:2-polyprenyl-3-methyl-5-hydroxy-6-metoxy-1,4-benzoquinol methylase